MCGGQRLHYRRRISYRVHSQSAARMERLELFVPSL